MNHQVEEVSNAGQNKKIKKLLTAGINGVILEPSNSKGVSDTADRELISIFKRGSWFRVTFLTGNRMEHFKAQGVAKTREAIQYYGVKHTPGNPYMATVGIHLPIFFKKIEEKVDKLKHWD